jgi:glycosyltransferase involved in cell wall biosynthesis
VVLVAKKFLLIGGYPRSLLNFRGQFLRTLVAKGLDVHAAVPDLPHTSELRHQLEALGVKVHEFALKRTGMNPLKDLMTFFWLCSLMRRVKPDYTLGYTIKPVIYGSLAASLSGVSRRFALITGLGYAFTGEQNFKRALVQKLARKLYSLSLMRTEKVFFQNPDDESLFRTLKVLPESIPSLVINGSGVDLELYTVAPLPKDSIAFLLIARLLGDKGIREYVGAAEEVKKQYPEVKFMLVGDVDENPDSVQAFEIKQWECDGTIDYLGWLEDVRSVIADCSVYVLPSYREGIPRTVLEAMAMGRPIITTDAPGCRETVVEGENGFLVPVKDSDALAVAMKRFIREPRLAERMGNASLKLARNKYDVNKVNTAIMQGMGL